MARSLPSPCAPTHVGSTSETEFGHLCSSDALGRHYAQSQDVSGELTLDESVYLVQPVWQEVEAHRPTFNYSGNPPHKIPAQNRSAVLLSVAVAVPAPAAVLAPAVLLIVALPVHIDDAYLAHVRLLRVANARETPEQIKVKPQSSYEYPYTAMSEIVRNRLML